MNDRPVRRATSPREIAMAHEDQQIETLVRVAYGMHSGSPKLWGWEVSGRNGYGWGTAQSEREAMLDCISYLQTNNL